MKTFQQLKEAHLPICNWREFLKFTPDANMPFLPQKDADTLDEYFRHFLHPNNSCIKCGHQLGNDSVLDEFLKRGRFKPTEKFGEGLCSTGGCGWPGRYIHLDVGPVQRLDMILQYHPDIITEEIRRWPTKK